MTGDPAAAGPPRAVLIGIGSPFRRDDGVGPAVLARIEAGELPGVAVTESDGEPTRLLDAWAGVPLAVVVDAVLCEHPRPGRIHRTEVDLAGEARLRASLAAATGLPGAGASTHGLGVPDAVRLAMALDRAPGRLVVLAVEAADIGFGTGLSPAVTACLPGLARAVLAELAP